jgi:hypothetical protein
MDHDPPWQETGASLPWRELVVERPDVLIIVTTFVAYGTGVAFDIDARATDDWALRDIFTPGADRLFNRVFEEPENREALEGLATEMPEHGLKITAIDTGAGANPNGCADLSAHLRGGQGNAHTWEEHWWLRPLPTGTALELTFAWHAPDLADSTMRLDAAELRAAAAQSRQWVGTLPHDQ